MREYSRKYIDFFNTQIWVYTILICFSTLCQIGCGAIVMMQWRIHVAERVFWCSRNMYVTVARGLGRYVRTMRWGSEKQNGMSV